MGRLSPLRGRTAIAAVVVVALVGALGAAWAVAAWHDVDARRRALVDEPGAAASRRGAELALELRAQLAALAAREAARPYFHYQNLFHDPRAGGVGVAPSPLASGRPEPLVLDYFERAPDGRVDVPGINDDVPELSDAARLAEHRAFRAEVIRGIAGALVDARATSARTSIARYDAGSYLQNTNANVVYQRQNAPTSGGNEPLAPEVAGIPGEVTITISALAWRTLPYGGGPALVATRTLDAPRGRSVQGFVVDRAALTAWIAERAGDTPIALATEPDTAADAATEIAPGWHLHASANPRAVATAAAAARGEVRGFALRALLLGVLALAAGAFVVWLVARAEQLARERSQFAAAAAHELRTPLAGLQLYGDMLAGGLGDPGKAADYARRMSEEAARLGRVVSNVLGFSQLERGNLSVEPRVDSLADALRELAARAEPALDRAGCALALEVPPALDARFDRDAVARIVGNLLDNAEKYTRQAADRTITLQTRALPAAGGIEVVVADHGPGVREPAALFAPFARGGKADADGDKPAGLGLGLALSRSLARAMTGELAYRPHAGGGAEFVLTLPRA